MDTDRWYGIMLTPFFLLIAAVTVQRLLPVVRQQGIRVLLANKWMVFRGLICIGGLLIGIMLLAAPRSTVTFTVVSKQITLGTHQHEYRIDTAHTTWFAANDRMYQELQVGGTYRCRALTFLHGRDLESCVPAR